MVSSSPRQRVARHVGGTKNGRHCQSEVVGGYGCRMPGQRNAAHRETTAGAARSMSFPLQSANIIDARIRCYIHDMAGESNSSALLDVAGTGVEEVNKVTTVAVVRDRFSKYQYARSAVAAAEPRHSVSSPAHAENFAVRRYSATGQKFSPVRS